MNADLLNAWIGKYLRSYSCDCVLGAVGRSLNTHDHGFRAVGTSHDHVFRALLRSHNSRDCVFHAARISRNFCDRFSMTSEDRASRAMLFYMPSVDRGTQAIVFSRPSSNYREHVFRADGRSRNSHNHFSVPSDDRATHVIVFSVPSEGRTT